MTKQTAWMTCVTLLLALGAACGDTPLAQTPPLGYNSYDSYGCNIYEEVAMKEIDAFIEKFAPHGYEYFVIDNGWFSSPESRKFDGYLVPLARRDFAENVTVNAYGVVQPSELFFPNGLKPMIDKLHAHGLKFGVHLMRGIPRVAVERDLPIKGTEHTARDIYTEQDNCPWCDYMHGVDMTQPGAQAFYNSVFDQFAEWGVDFVKIDDVTHHPAEIEAYVKAAEQCGRPIVLSLSPGGATNAKYLDTYRKTHMLRTTPDIWDNQESLDRSFASMRQWQGMERPGFWPDLDMIPFGELCILNRAEVMDKPEHKSVENFMGHMHHWCQFTEAQKQTFITQRAIAASPIMIGGSMISMDEHSYDLLTNKQMLACVNNGVHGMLVHEHNGIEVWNAPVANSERFGYQEYRHHEGWLAVFNRTDEQRTAHIRGRFLRFLPRGRGTYDLTDVWGDQSVEGYTGGRMTFEVEPHGVVFLKYAGTPASERRR